MWGRCGSAPLGCIAAAALVAVAASSTAQGSAAAERIEGTWLNGKGDGKVEIYRCDGKYCGKIVWLTVPGVKVPLDVHNPDPALRHRKLQGLRVIDGLEYDGDTTWSGGTIYDPRSGHTYSFKASLKGDDVLRLRGYVLLPLFGRTEVWHRVQGTFSQGAPEPGTPAAPTPTSAPPPAGPAGRGR